MAKNKKPQNTSTNNINKRYIEEYLKNEADANKNIANALLFTSILLTIAWVLYFIPGFFRVTHEARLVTLIALPILILILIIPKILVKFNFGSKPGFKYFVIISLLLVFAMLNVIMPKHAILGWAITILVANHYYNPKVGRVVYISTLVMMIICIYLGMFFGEYDPNLLMGELDDIKSEIHSSYTASVFPDTPAGRLAYLTELYSLGWNRYLTAIIFYYLPRAIVVSILFFVSNSLNKRTYKLLVNEIQVGAEQQKISTELEVAKDIQLATLPSEFITNKDVEIMAELKAAKEVGGDFYDYFNLDEDHVAVVIGDVSGKGIPAAMFMMKTITCFKNYISVNKTPSQVLKEVNKTIYEGNTNQMFVTCFLAIIDTKTGLMRYSNAGHNPPIIGKNKNYRYLKCNTGFILGGLPDTYVKDEELVLEHGDHLVIYTDGVTEARNKKGEFYGETRLINFFNSREFNSLVHMHHELKDDIASFVDGAEQSDDLTYLTVVFHGDECIYNEKLVEGKMENIPVLLDFMKEFIEKNGFPKAFKNNLLVVGDELFSNIVKYGYKDMKGDIFLRLLFNKTTETFVMTIIDTGEEFNQLEVNDQPIEGDISERKEGGLGLLIVKNIMTEYAYDRIYGKNIITLKKKIEKSI